jgi:cyclopropane fatty-acyl-phospholipid synthase-like methyltransferase
MESLYERWIDAEHSKQKRNDWDRRQYKIQKASYLRSFFENRNQPEDLRVLDFGMGWGGYLVAVRAWGCDVHGVEVSDVRRETVQTENIAVYEDIAEVSGEFDVIASHQTFEHIPSPNETLASLCKLLADDGLLHITTPTVTRSPSIETVLTKGPFQPPEHINGFTKKSILKMSDKYNLEPINVDQSLVQHPKSQSLPHRIKLLLLLINMYWLYDRFNNRGQPSTFTLVK